MATDNNILIPQDRNVGADHVTNHSRVILSAQNATGILSVLACHGSVFTTIDVGSDFGTLRRSNSRPQGP